MTRAHLHIVTQAATGQFPASFARFETLVGEKHCRRRARSVREAIRENQYLERFLLRENRITMTLDGWWAHKQKHGTIPDIKLADPLQYEAITFVTQCVAFLDTADEADARAFLGRVRGCFKNPEDLRALAFELAMTTHLVHSGTAIHLPRNGTYDWSCDRDGLSFEVECKSFSPDKGRQIHLRDGLNLFHLVNKELGRILNRLTDGLLVRISVPGRLPRAHSERKRIALDAKETVLAARDARTALARISQQHFVSKGIPMTDGDALREFLQQRFGIGNQQTIAITRGKGVFVIVVESETPDDVLGEVMETLRKAARDQFTGAAPGLLCAKLEGLTADELVELGTGQPSGAPSALAVLVNQLMNSSSLEHVAWVVFLADGDVERTTAGAWRRNGASFAFRNPRSPFNDDSRLRLFAA